GWSLLRFADAGGGERYLRAGRAALDRACRARPDTRDGWCHGLPGVALAYADLLGAGGLGGAGHASGRFADRLDRALPGLLREVPRANHSLCHGELGNLEPLAVAATRGHWEAARALTDRTALMLGT